MNNYAKKLLLYIAMLLTVPVSIFGLSQNEIDRLTAHLPQGGYGIRKKLMQEHKKPYLTAITNKRDSCLSTRDDQKLADKILKQNKQVQINKQIKHQSLLAAMTTGMVIIPLRQQSTPHRFDGSALFGFLTTAISPIMTLVGISFLIWKIEHFVNGPALAKIITEEAERKRDIERVLTEVVAEKKINEAAFKEFRAEHDSLKKLVEDTHEDIKKDLEIIAQEQHLTIRTVEEAKSLNGRIQKITTEKILPKINQLSQQVTGLRNGTVENQIPFSCCPLDLNDVISPADKKSSSRLSSLLDDEKKN